MFRVGSLLFACVVAVGACLSLGCSAGGSDGGETGADVSPRTGVWFYDEGANVSDSCMVPGWDVDNSTEFGLTNNGDGSFTVVREGQDIECTVPGEDFSCLAVSLDPIMQAGIDATFNLEVTYVGNFTSDTSLDGERTIDVSCTGSACEAAATSLMTSFPCAIVDGFSASSN